MMKEANKSKYSHLELELQTASRRFSNYDEMKNLVVKTYTNTPDVESTKPIALAKALKLEPKSTFELVDLDNKLMRPMQVHFSLMGECIKEGLQNIDPELGKAKSRERMVDNFVESFFELYRTEGLEDKPEIKSAIIYPLLISTFNGWKKHNEELVKEFVSAVKKNEKDKRMLIIIDLLDVDDPKNLKRN
jgi:hypothetical protein